MGDAEEEGYQKGFLPPPPSPPLWNHQESQLDEKETRFVNRISQTEQDLKKLFLQVSKSNAGTVGGNREGGMRHL